MYCDNRDVIFSRSTKLFKFQYQFIETESNGLSTTRHQILGIFFFETAKL